MNFEFEEIAYRSNCHISVIREVSTDCLYLQYQQTNYSGFAGGLTPMLDPSTGKPLTYANWKEKYANK